MSKITASTDIQQVKPDEVPRFVDLFAQDVVDVVNGKLGFADNFDATTISATFSTTNDNTGFPHGLGRVPSGYIPVSMTAAMVIYDGTLSSTANTIYLRSSAVGTVQLLIY